jgi:hypothetical protein
LKQRASNSLTRTGAAQGFGCESGNRKGASGSGGIVFIEENGGGSSVRLGKRQHKKD